MTARLRRAVLALVLSVLLVGSAVTAGVGATDHRGADGTPADEAYVTDDGDVVLVYEEGRSPEETTEGQYGLDVGENLVYALVTDSVEEEPDARWALTAVAEPSLFSADGSLSFSQPDNVESFELSTSGESTAEDSWADFDLSTTVADDGGFAAVVQSVTTDGEVTMGPDRFRATGTFDARTVMPVGESGSMSVSFSETDAGYDLAVQENRRVSEFELEDWQNRSAARETIREQYAPFDDSALQGSSDVSIESYSLTESDTGHRLDISYSVAYRDVDQTLRQLLVAGFAQQPDTSGEDAQRLADELLATNVEEMSFSYSVEGGSITGSFTVDVTDYDGLALAYLEYAESLQSEGASSTLEQARSQFEAQQAAGLEQRYTWDGDLEGTGDALVLDLTFDYRTTNWAEYVTELQERDLPWYESEFSLEGSSDGDRIAIEGSAEMEGEQLFENVGEQLSGGMATGAAAPEWTESLARSEPQRAKLDASYDGDGLRIEAGAAFGNLAALRDDVAAEYDAPDVSSVVGRLEGDADTTYVRVDGAVSGSASESDVRELSAVDASTTVHMPGEWDREFPSMDAEQARAFLGIDEGSTDGGLGPGFGVAVAVVALFAAGLLVARRR